MHMLNYFTNFDQLIGTKLIKILYFLGLAGIVFFGLVGIIAGFAAMGQGFFAGIGAIIATLIGTAIAVVFWRFMCEIYLLFFRLSDDVRDIKNHQLGIEANTKDVDIDL